MARAKQGPTNAEIMNEIRDSATAEFQNAVPEVSGVADYRTYADIVLGNDNLKNEFINGFTNKVCTQYVHSRRLWKNPLAKFKKSDAIFGDTASEIAVNLFKAKEYNPGTDNLNPGEVFKQTVPEAYEIFHKLNRQKKYPASINEDLLARAMLNEGGLSGFVEAVMIALYNSDTNDEYIATRKLLSDEYDKGRIIPFKVKKPADTTKEEDYKNITELARSIYLDLSFLKPYYNSYGLQVATLPEDLFLFVTPQMRAGLDVQVLANAFNMDKTTLMGNIVIIDKFDNPNLLMIMGDRDMFFILDKVYKTTSIYNPDTLNYNVFLHHHETISFSYFVNAIAFTTEDVKPLLTSAETVAKGSEIKLTTKLKGLDLSKTAMYEINAKSAKTYIDIRPDGAYLVVDSKEGQTPISVTATIGNVVSEVHQVTVTG